MAFSTSTVWFRVDITLAHLDSTATKVLSFTNRNAIGESSAIYYPLLVDINGCGMTVGQDGMPVQSTGSITINDPLNSIGNRRVADLLQEYTAVQQTVQIYAAELAIDDTSPYADWASQWKGKITSIDKGLDDVQQLIFNVEAMALPTTSITPLLSETTGTTIEIDEVKGEVWPQAFGASLGVSAEVHPIRIASGTAPKWAYHAVRTSPARDYDTSDFVDIRIPDEEGVYRTVFDGNDTDPRHYLCTTGSTYPSAAGTSERAWRLSDLTNDPTSPSSTGPQGTIITSLRWRFKGQNTVLAPTGALIFTIYELDSLGAVQKPGQVLATATANKADYWTELSGASDFWVYASFDRPVHLRYSLDSPTRPGYAVSMRQDTYATSTTDFVDGGHTSSPTARYWSRTDLGQWGEPTDTSADTSVFGLYAAELTLSDASIVSTGGGTYTGKVITLSQKTAGTNQTNPEIEYDLVVLNEQVIDDAAGTVTGAADDYIGKSPVYVIKYLTQTFDGTNWALSSDWDVSRFSTRNAAVIAGPVTRKVSGAITQESTLDQVISQLAAETAIYVVQLTSGKFAVALWGYQEAVTKVFTDEDIANISLSEADISSVINRAQVFYSESLTQNRGLIGAAQGSFEGYSSFVDWKDGGSVLQTALTSRSVDLYGERQLNRIQSSFIGDSTTAESLAQYYLSTFDYPHRTISFDVPFWENRALELMDIVEVISAKLPAVNGTSPEAPRIYFEGQEVDLIPNDRQVQAQRYRCVLVGRSLSAPRDGAPTLRLTARVISPYHPNDPT